MTAGFSFALEITGTGGRRVVRATGRLVAGAGAEGRGWDASGAFAGTDEVVLDLGGVTAIDAGGVGRLVGLRQALARRGTRLTIAAASPRVRRVLRVTALDTVFAIAPGHLADGPVADVTRVPARVCRCA